MLASVTGVAARTISRILARHGVPRLADCDSVTGEVIASSRRSDRRYEHPESGDLVHVDVKKLGRTPDGGGWRVHGRDHVPSGHQNMGYDYVHAMVDDHSRLAYAEVLPDEKATTCAGFLTRAAAAFTAAGIPAIRRVLTDNAWAYRRSHAFRAAVAELGATQKFIRPRCPWTNGNGSTAPWPESGPTGGPTTPTRPPPWPSTAGSSTTPPDAPTPPATATHPQAACHQCDGRVHLVCRAVD